MKLSHLHRISDWDSQQLNYYSTDLINPCMPIQGFFLERTPFGAPIGYRGRIMYPVLEQALLRQVFVFKKHK